MVGIYFLKQKNKVVYVGQSINIYRRVEQHKDKIFDSYDFIECDKNLLNSNEEFFILAYNPIYNKKRAEIVVGSNDEKVCKKLKKIKKEIQDGYKHLRVKEDTHKKVKAIAALNGTGIDDAILLMVEAYKNKGVSNGNNDYRKR